MARAKTPADELDDVVTTSNVERLRADLEVAELEQQLVAAKDEGTDIDRSAKDELREARRRARTLREGGDPEDGVARPDTTSASARTE
jgi:hypothetical protein